MSEVNTKFIVTTIEATPGWVEAKERYHIGTKRGPDKYFHTHVWVKEALRRWEALDRAVPTLVNPNLKVLDIGAGFGYFSIVGKEYTGSDQIELSDVPNPMHDAVTSSLGLSKHTLEVCELTPMPLKGRYDLVTAYRIVFDGGWGEKEYRFFLRDIRDSLLNEGGSVVLGFNNKREKRFMEWAAPLGARYIGKHDVLLPYEVLNG